MGLRTWLTNLNRTTPHAAEARLAAIVSHIASLTSEQVRGEVQQELASGAFFRVQAAPPAAAETARLGGLPPISRDFFTRYKKVESNSMEVGRDDIKPYPRGRGYLQIGSDLADTDVILERATDRVAVVEDDEESELNLEETHASIWHYLLYVIETGRMPGG